MKAAIYTQYGPPEVVSVAEVSTPQPTANEVLIKIYATTVNRTDCGFRSAEYFVSRFWSGLLRPKGKILGNEFAGEIAAIGTDVTGFSVGDRVFGYDDTRFGSHAEYKIMDANDPLATIPEGWTYEDAAPLTEGAHYALGNIKASKVTSGQYAMVYGATGAIGSAAVQLLTYFGVHVTAVCQTKNLGLVEKLGAQKVIDYLNEDFTKTDRRFDFIFDAVGKSSFGQCKPLLTTKGVYISTELGKNSENIFLALVGMFSTGKKVLFPIPKITKEDVLFLRDLAESGHFKPIIDRHYSLEQIVDAYRYVETGQKTGNVVITITA
ncbi:NADPH:quinone oxidoreductase [Parapedobacter pyrenivorans]|uniref:NADPH:quinone oxidoreductase n=1 Tax=Parapedobacter pyrenivorans TaxID=1305674 RepID=A0A917I2Y9_9SPHI|nr:NAD(P)-dependent alcohol dehydrogenase [Parapedobacter pyrenivorans]GGH04754.1 NADPH:quinone oxidoreductase [Parapedobacter pyrenivorans]